MDPNIDDESELIDRDSDDDSESESIIDELDLSGVKKRPEKAKWTEQEVRYP